MLVATPSTSAFPASGWLPECQIKAYISGCPLIFSIYSFLSPKIHFCMCAWGGYISLVIGLYKEDYLQMYKCIDVCLFDCITFVWNGKFGSDKRLNAPVGYLQLLKPTVHSRSTIVARVKFLVTYLYIQ